jgi:hypothetical protein
MNSNLPSAVAASPATSPPAHPAPRHAMTRGVVVFLALVGSYLLVSYGMLPWWWERYEGRHPALDELPGITITGDKHPGDPINVALVGSEDDVKRIMQAAGWVAADPLGLKSDLKIAADTVLARPYAAAPVSNLYLFGHKEDLAFEQPVGHDPRKRHHVRYWKSPENDEQGRPLWAGAVTYDKHVGLSYTTGQITHHIDGNVDAERDRLFSQLSQTGLLSSVQSIPDFHPERTGKNGGGDKWFTDGKLLVGTIRAP